MNLYEINKAYQDVLENGFSFDEETGEILFDSESLDLLEDEFKNKVDNIVSFIKNQEVLKDGISNEIKVLNERKKDIDKKIEWLKGYITDSMHIRGMSKMETPRNKISFRLSQSVDVKDESLIDGHYFTEKVERKLDKKALLADLKKGTHVEGAELLKKQNLQIK